MPHACPVQVQGPKAEAVMAELAGDAVLEVKYYWSLDTKAGRPHGIRPIAPCEARRIEAGIFNCNSDFTAENNPFEVTGLERLVEVQEADYVGKAALERIRDQGVTRRLVGIEAPGDPSFSEITEARPVLAGGQRVGRVTDLVWSPRLQRISGTSGCPPSSQPPATTWRSNGTPGNEPRQDRGDPLPRPTQARA